MNRVNRVIVIVVTVLAIALMPILVVMLLSLSPALVETWGDMARGLLVGPSAPYTQAIGIVMAVLVLVLAIVLAVLEIQQPANGGMRVQQVADGEVQITVEAITQRLQNEILKIPEVTRVKPSVVGSKQGLVDLFLQIETTPDVIVPTKTEEMLAAARQLMEEKMGLKLGRIRVQIDHTRPPKGNARGVKSVNSSSHTTTEPMFPDR